MKNNIIIIAAESNGEKTGENDLSCLILFLLFRSRILVFE